MKDIELKPCTFCGGIAYISLHPFNHPHIDCHHSKKCKMRSDTWLLSALKELDDAPVEMLKVADDSVEEYERINRYYFVDTIEVDLRNNTYFDVSQWEGDVKPVKAILSICMSKETTCNVMNDTVDNWNKLGKSSNFDVNLTIGNMICLMEDGTFKSVD